MLQGPKTLGYERPLVIRLSFSTCVVATVSLPLFGLICCVLISSLFHYEDATRTHCKVANFLPSISASIGLSPECYIWRFSIGLHSAPRFLLAFTYFSYYKTYFGSKFPQSLLGCLSLAFSFLETFGLLLLSYVSSSEAYSVHKEAFVLFVLSSLFYMITTCCLWGVIKRCSLNSEDAKSHHWKVRFLRLYITFCAFAGFFLWKHNTYCESGSYSVFAVFEYLIVLVNMAFHLTAVWDFKSQEVMVSSSPEEKCF